MRHKFLSGLLAVVFVLWTGQTVAADVGDFTGKWRNVNASTGGITSLKIEAQGKGVSILAWGKCLPSDCPWGHAFGTIYTTAGETAAPGATLRPAQVVSTIYIMSFSQRILTIRPIENERIEVEELTKYTDGTGRTPVRFVYTFARVEESGSR